MNDKKQSKHTGLQKQRREYGGAQVDKQGMNADPMIQFKQWLNEAIQQNISDPTAMVLATVDSNGIPNTRVVLLKDIIDNHFIFYTNYQSKKAQEIEQNSYAALNFYWSTLSHQVRIRGKITRVADKLSDQYFASRPHKSQIAAIISPQSSEIPNRAVLDDKMQASSQLYQDTDVPRPEYWGGYQLAPIEFEFWQGRNNRLHDRIVYQQVNGLWEIKCLAP